MSGPAPIGTFMLPGNTFVATEEDITNLGRLYQRVYSVISSELVDRANPEPHPVDYNDCRSDAEYLYVPFKGLVDFHVSDVVRKLSLAFGTPGVDWDLHERRPVEASSSLEHTLKVKRMARAKPLVQQSLTVPMLSLAVFVLGTVVACQTMPRFIEAVYQWIWSLVLGSVVD